MRANSRHDRQQGRQNCSKVRACRPELHCCFLAPRFSLKAVPTSALRDGVTRLLSGDHARALEVWEASTRATHTFITEQDIRALRRSVRYGLTRFRQVHTVRDGNDVAVGFIALGGDKVEMLFVHPDYRATGVGKRLMRFAVDDLGATRVDVNEQNDQALDFYLHLGFRVVGRSEDDGSGQQPYPLLHLNLA